PAAPTRRRAARRRIAHARRTAACAATLRRIAIAGGRRAQARHAAPAGAVPRATRRARVPADGERRRAQARCGLGTGRSRTRRHRRVGTDRGVITRDAAAFVAFARGCAPDFGPATAKAAFLVSPDGFARADESARDNRYMADAGFDA